MNASGARAVLRIARRNVVRARWRSILIVLLVLLPVTGMVAAITLLRTSTPTPEARAVNALGQADLLVYPRTALATSDGLRSALPAGSRVEATTYAEARIILPGRQLRVTERSLDLSGLAQGMLTLLAGRPPSAATEVAVTRSVEQLTGLSIGSPVQLLGREPATIVGIVENPASLSQRLVLLDPALAEDPRNIEIMAWLVSLPDGANLDENLDPVTGEVGVGLGPTYDAQTRTQWAGSNAPYTPGVMVVGALALIETVLVASAAFAVSIRRRQRELGILAASGAQPRHLAGTVIGEALVLGGIASALGAVLGVAAILAILPWLDELTNRRNPGLTIDFGATLVACAIGVGAALLAAAVPAWTATRVPVLMALSGRRPPVRRARRILLFGLALIGGAGVMVVGGAGLALQYESRDAGLMLLVGGAVLGVLGFGACSPWLIELLEGIGRRLPTSARIAFRDTARARSRSAPIVTAILSGMAATVAIAAFSASYSARTIAEWKPPARADQLILSGDDAVLAGQALATEMDAVAGAQAMSPDGEETSVQLRFSVIGPKAPGYLQPDSEWDYASRVAVGDEKLLRALAGESAAAALGAGKVVVLTQHALEIDEVLVVVERWDELNPNAAPEPELHVLPAEAVAVGLDPAFAAVPGAVLSRDLASELGLQPFEDSRNFIIRLDHTVTEGDLARAGAFVSSYVDTWVNAWTGPDRTADLLRWVAMALSLLLALSITAIAVALGEAESRADQRTLLAVGAGPGIRRRIAAARAGVLALLAGVLAVPAGLLPAWGLLASREVPLIIPINEIVAATLLLPTAAIVGALLLSRPIPNWSAFRDVGSA